MTTATDIADINTILQEDAEDTSWMDAWSDYHDQQLQQRFGEEPPLL